MQDVNPYLEQEVMSASPFRLRYLLIQRAHDLTAMVGTMWSQGEFEGARQWALRVREILGELLAGIRDAENPVSQPVADFYIFLLKLLTQAENTADSERLATLQELLSIEAETWKLVTNQFAAQEGGLDSGLILADRTVQTATPIAPLETSTDLYAGGFSLEI